MAAAGRLPSARADAAVPTIGRTVYLLGDTANPHRTTPLVLQPDEAMLVR
jgi:hypothetical protein